PYRLLRQDALVLLPELPLPVVHLRVQIAHVTIGLQVVLHDVGALHLERGRLVLEGLERGVALVLLSNRDARRGSRQLSLDVLELALDRGNLPEVRPQTLVL